MMTFNEPIPDFSTRYPKVLESCLAAPFQTFTAKSLYPTFVDKASVLLSSWLRIILFKMAIIMIALTTLFVFLYKNKKWLRIDTQELYNFTMWIAQSPPRYKEEALKAIGKFVKDNIINLKGA